ncbi:MAG: Fe-S cluster assembly protein SufD [Bacteroidales bacterium]|nr:Fe-S cluster assembly protein SufD [Bacteroidales bacterium]
MIRKDILPEALKGVDFSDFWNDDLVRPTEGKAEEIQCSCNIPNLDTERRTIVNGYGDGLEIRVGERQLVERPIQIQSVVHTDYKSLVELHNTIVVGEGAQVKIIHCDDTIGDTRSLSNNETTIEIGEGAVVEYYKLQNINNRSGLINKTRITMAEGSTLRTNCITLNGGHIYNHYEIRMKGPHCELQADGLYLIDSDQKCDNYIFVQHDAPHCKSRELYKGILDDQARARFNGHVLVMDGAAKTEAYQTNRNILLTDKAHVETKPFLEIYNDDVKCSHGSTVGQLDEQALFYMRSRGISERVATTMLSYAFCDEVIREIGIPELRLAIEDMVKKRLHGELLPCSNCALQCSTPCNGAEAHFDIDISKL